MLRSKRLRLLTAVLVGAALLGTANPARANFILRATDVNSGGAVIASVTDTGLSAVDGSGSLIFSHVVGNFSIVLLTIVAATGPDFTSVGETLNIAYIGPTGATSDKLIIEMLGNLFTNPDSPDLSDITSNASPSTSGLLASSVIMTSGVVAGNVVALGAAGTTLGGQLGMTTATGTMGSAPSVLTPNPVIGSTFNIANPFSFYQTYTISGFGTSGLPGSLSAGSTVSVVSSVSAPAGLVMVLTGLPLLGVGGWLRRRRRRAVRS